MSDDATVHCDHCGHDVPPGEFCIRCGTPLALHPEHPRRRASRAHHFAAAPHEPAWALRLVSTLFPQLPAHAMLSFRVALVSGLALIVGLGLLGVFPVALLAAGVLIPLLLLLYLYDVDIYEDEPLLVVGFTVVWGAVGGVALGLVVTHLSLPAQPHGWSQLGNGAVLVRVLAVPVAGVLLALAGLLVLLRHPRFNDVLDGAIFGVAAAVALQSAILLVTAWPVTGLGVRPDQDATTWTVRLVELGVLAPLVVAGATGWAGAALWARFRAPLRDRKALGPLGDPVACVVVAAGFAVAAALAQQVFGTLGRFLTLAVLAAAALVLLRWAIHVGLLEEANDADPDEVVRCVNCGRPTALHTFCAACGVALRALPKRAGGEETTSP